MGFSFAENKMLIKFMLTNCMNIFMEGVGADIEISLNMTPVHNVNINMLAAILPIALQQYFM